MKGVSIIICCFNSSQRINETLRYIFLQEFTTKIKCEVLIIDNNSTDETSGVVKNICNRNKQNIIPFKVIQESTSGLSHARRKGIQEAKYEYLLFCDDDNWLNQNYVQRAFDFMENHQDVGIVGGRSEAVSHIPFPYWFTTYQTNYAVGVQALTSGDVSPRGYVWGAGMVIRRSVIIRLLNCGFTTLLADRKGNELSSGGDSELSKWYLIAGYKLWYNEDLFFNHFIPEERLKKEYLIKLNNGINASEKILYNYSFYIHNIQNKTQKYKVKLFLKYLIKYLISKDKYSKLNIDFLLPIWYQRGIDANIISIKTASRNWEISNSMR